MKLVVLLLLCLAGLANAQNLFVASWDRSPEPQVVGYRVYWGGASGDYQGVRDVGNETNSILPGSWPIWVAVTAYDDQGLETPFSLEAHRATNGPASIKLRTPRFATLTNTVAVVPAPTNYVDGVYIITEAVLHSGVVVGTMEGFCPLYETVGPVMFKSRGVFTNMVRQPYTKALIRMKTATAAQLSPLIINTTGRMWSDMTRPTNRLDVPSVNKRAPGPTVPKAKRGPVITKGGASALLPKKRDDVI